MTWLPYVLSTGWFDWRTPRCCRWWRGPLGPRRTAGSSGLIWFGISAHPSPAPSPWGLSASSAGAVCSRLVGCRKSTYMPIRSHSRHGKLISQLDMGYSLFSQCHFHMVHTLHQHQLQFFLFFLSFFFFFAHTTFNRAIAVLFHPRREGSISCVSASDPSYLKTRQWAQSNALGQPLHRNTLVHPQHAIISLCM